MLAVALAGIYDADSSETRQDQPSARRCWGGSATRTGRADQSNIPSVTSSLRWPAGKAPLRPKGAVPARSSTERTERRRARRRVQLFERSLLSREAHLR